MNTNTTINILILFVFISCSNEKIELEYESDMEKEFYTYYEKGSETPYSGKYISKAANDNVTIDFKNGKMDGEFIRLNNQEDTIEYNIYKNGRNLLEVDFLYEEGKLTRRNAIKDVKGSQEDEKVFNKVASLIMSNDFYELDNFLNPLFRGHYKSEFNNLTNQFGRLKNIEIKEIRKKTNSYKNREDIRAKMIFNYEDLQLNSSFLIVKEEDGGLNGQAFTRRPIPNELLPDNNIEEVIDILINKDVERFLTIKHLDSKYRREIEEYLNDFGVISSTYKFLETDFIIGERMVYLKKYLVDIDGEKQILTLKYNVISNNVLDLRLFYISPYRREFKVLHF